MKILLVLLFLAATSVTAQESKPFNEDWRIVSVTRDDNGKMESIYAFKKSSVVKRNGYVSLWLKQFYFETHLYTQIAVDIRCNTQELRFTQIIDYDANGKITKRNAFNDDVFESQLPESNGELVILKACAYVKSLENN